MNLSARCKLYFMISAISIVALFSPGIIIPATGETRGNSSGIELSPQGLVDISGKWYSSIHRFYHITQEGSRFRWTVQKSNETARGTISRNSISVTWKGTSGSGSTTGIADSMESGGKAGRIEWANGIVFTRTAGAVKDKPGDKILKATGWCCKDGEIFRADSGACREGGGQFFPTRKEAERNCREKRSSPKVNPAGRSINQFDQIHWKSMGGPWGGDISQMVKDPYVQNRLYVITGRGVYMSSNMGENWTIMQDTGKTGSHMALSKNRIFLSGDHLTFFDRVSRKKLIEEQNTRMVFVEDNKIYLTQTGGPAKPGLKVADADSVQHSFTWTDITPPDTLFKAKLLATRGVGDMDFQIFFNGILVSGQHILVSAVSSSWAHGGAEWGNRVRVGDAGYWGGVLLRSNDGGKSWATVTLPGVPLKTAPHKLYKNPADPNHFMIGMANLQNRLTGSDGEPFPVSDLLYESKDRGKNWNKAAFINPDFHAWRINDINLAGNYCHILTDDTWAYLYQYNKGYRKYTDKHWPKLSAGKSVEIIDLIFDDADINSVISLGSWTAIASRNGGKSWKRIDKGIVISASSNIALHPTSAGTLFTSGNMGHKPSRTKNSGAHWDSSPELSVFTDELIFDVHNPNHLITMDELTHLHESLDQGNNWKRIARHFSGNRVFDFEISRKAGGTAYVSNLGTGVSRFKGINSHVNNGSLLEEDVAYWQHLLDSPDYAYDIALDPEDDQILYASYSPKIFENFARIWKFNGKAAEGKNFTKILQVDNATAITSLEIDPSRPNNIYAGFTGKKALLMKSGNRGSTWQPMNGRFSFVTIHEMAIDPHNDSIVYAAPWGGGLFMSKTAGLTWNPLKTPTPSISAIFVDPADSSHLLIGDRTRPVIWESKNKGQTWKPVVKLDNKQYYRIFSLIIHHNTLYFSVMKRSRSMMALFSDPMSGKTFRLIGGKPRPLEGGNGRVVLNFFSHPKTLYAVTHISGVYKLAGNRWKDITGDLGPVGLNNIIAGSDHKIYVAGGCDFNIDGSQRLKGDVNKVNQIYQSSNGVNWKPLLTGNPFSSGVKKLLQHPENKDLFFAATASGVWVLNLKGKAWSSTRAWVQEVKGLGFHNIGSMAVGKNRIYAGTLGGGVYSGQINADNSITWAESTGPYPEIYNVQIKVDPARSSTIYASAYPGGVFKTTDSGSTWTESNFGLPSFSVIDPMIQGYYSLEIDPGNSNILYLGIFGKGVYKSYNGGITWLPMYGKSGQNTRIMRLPITKIRVDPTNSRNVYLATRKGIYKSANGGETWSNFNKGLKNTQIISLQIDKEGVVYIGTAGYDIYFRNPRSDYWSHMGRTTGFGKWNAWDRKLYQYGALLSDPRKKGRIFLGHFPGGFFVSEDNGHSWTSSNLGMGNDGLFSLVMHPTKPNILFAGSYNGVIKSENSGKTWQLKSKGMPSEQWPFAVVIDNKAPQVMYTATKNGQNKGFCDRNTFCGVLMKSINSGETWFKIMNGLSDRAEFYGLVIHPKNHNMLFLSTSRGVFASKNAGKSWVTMNNGLPSTENQMRDNVAQPLKLAADGHTLVLSLVGYGIWKTDISGLVKSN